MQGLRGGMFFALHDAQREQRRLCWRNADVGEPWACSGSPATRLPRQDPKLLLGLSGHSLKLLQGASAWCGAAWAACAHVVLRPSCDRQGWQAAESAEAAARAPWAKSSRFCAMPSRVGVARNGAASMLLHLTWQVHGAGSLAAPRAASS